MRSELGFPTEIEIIPRRKGEAIVGFRFRLHFPQSSASSPSEPIEFDATVAGAMTLMRGLQSLQARHGLPIPASLRPRGGRPALRLVEPTDDNEK